MRFRSEWRPYFWLHAVFGCLVLLALLSCMTKSDVSGSSQSVAAKPTQVRSMGNITLELLEQTGENLSFILRNDTDRPIYVSYVPSEQANRAKFLSYALERKSSKEVFESYGKGFHFVPRLAPVAPKTAIVFGIITPPMENGEYRVIVSYYDDEAIYKMLNEKGSNLTDTEEKEVDRKQLTVRSEVFAVR
jgi:hypothetical protein